MTPLRQWGRAWMLLALALAVHVLDEALTGFLPLYNEIVLGLRARHDWLPLPTFRFGPWLAGLALLVALIFWLGVLASRGRRWLRPVAYGLSAIMIGNALAHLGASLLRGAWMPGAYSSPLMLAAALYLLARTRALARHEAVRR